MSEPADLAGSCRMNRMLKTLAQAWVADLILVLGKTPATRFGALRRSLDGDVSARVLSLRLKELEALGFVSRNDAGTMPLHVDYGLTPAGRRLDTMLHESEMSSAELGLLDLFDKQPEQSTS